MPDGKVLLLLNTEDDLANDALLTLTADIVSAHVSNNSVAAVDLPTLISTVYGALSKISAPEEALPAKLVPAVSIRNSIKPDYIVCLEDGKKLTMLKRYLGRTYGITPDAYRAKWGLPKDYPMVAPNYTEKRRNLAKAVGLGRKAVEQVDAATAPLAAAVKASRRKLGIAAGRAVATPEPISDVIVAKPAPKRGRKPKAS
ncbi:MucR family transcriptional regulator [Sphingomonas sp. BIUV-7]|uniref:MucR family transcriptional regulator n=1 Tax=Sphingomonas natans TaxID=3063330 RepID=A0ABT8Y8L0_9SPHN|nr:MucR family transcriptional regulator [Sphingomonas sp. BIUV-7]MDO6414312.1 MucR family transcriptional regulator [Sphingomonas sp. BIUV-7]